MLLQTTHATFACIAFNDEFQSWLRYLQGGMLLQSVLLAVLGNKVALGYLNLLLCDVAVNLNEFHAVE